MSRLELNGALIAELDEHEVLMLQNLLAAGFAARLDAPMLAVAVRPDNKRLNPVEHRQVEYVDVTVQLRFRRERIITFKQHLDRQVVERRKV